MNSTNKRGLAVLGSTGSIGTQALEVVRGCPDHFDLRVLSAHNNIELLAQQAREFLPDSVVVTNHDKYHPLRDMLRDVPVKVFSGVASLESLMQSDEVDLVLTAMVGFAGLRPTVKAVEAGKIIALANKETLVVAGHLITELAQQCKAPIIPVDSEHSAIFQCLMGENQNAIERLILTASGGPFRGFSAQQLENATLEQALKHPNWEMGQKITIDSATMMNKGLEVIEAHHLFGVPVDNIDVVVHPQSIVHSMVEFADGSLKAQLGLPDMRLPIGYALGFPRRIPNSYPRLNVENLATLTFEPPDHTAFPALGLAFEALRKGGNACCVLNAANEVAVEAFLKGQITFMQIPALIEKSLHQMPHLANPTLAQVEETDKETRMYTTTLIK